MSLALAASGPFTREVRRAERPARRRALILAAPALLFLLITFVVPIGVLLGNAVANPETRAILPHTLAALESWSGHGVPDEAVFAALAADLRRARAERTAAQLGRRLNYELPGIRSTVLAGARLAAREHAGPYKAAFLAQDPAWGQESTWRIIRRNGSGLTPYYLLTTLDLRQTASGAIARVPPDSAIFLRLFARTFAIAAVVTLATLVLGYPLAHLMSTAPAGLARIILLCVLMPLWTSLLVCTTAWVVLLQNNGVINDVMMHLGLVAHRVQLIYTRFGTIAAMTQMQLPFTILPIYSVMRRIPQAQLRAARSLGAPPLAALLRVYVPQTLPGVAAGCLITFILSLGYYITPALVGGPNDQMISNFISLFIDRDLNWGLASALGVMLLVVTLAIYGVFLKVAGAERLRLG